MLPDAAARAALDHQEAAQAIASAACAESFAAVNFHVAALERSHRRKAKMFCLKRGHIAHHLAELWSFSLKQACLLNVAARPHYAIAFTACRASA